MQKSQLLNSFLGQKAAKGPALGTNVPPSLRAGRIYLVNNWASLKFGCIACFTNGRLSPKTPKHQKKNMLQLKYHLLNNLQITHTSMCWKFCTFILDDENIFVKPVGQPKRMRPSTLSLNAIAMKMLPTAPMALCYLHWPIAKKNTVMVKCIFLFSHAS